MKVLENESYLEGEAK